MTKAIIIHGAYSNPESNWIPWLKTQLEKRGYEVAIPQLSTPENQNLKQWKKEFQEQIGELEADTILIGHSIGAVFILTLLEESQTTINAAFLVAGWTGQLNQEIDTINTTFQDKEFDYNKIKKNAWKIFLYGADNDPYIPIEKFEELADNLEVDLTEIEDAGHFNTKSGYTEFDDLLIDIISIEHQILKEDEDEEE